MTSGADVSEVGWRVLEALIVSLILLVAITGNVSIWIIVYKSKHLHTETNMFILGLSAADLLVSLVNMPATVVAISLGRSPVSQSVCEVFGFINMFTFVSSVLSLCNISINRFVLSYWCTKYKWVYTTRNAVFMIVAVYVVAFLLSTPPLYGWGEYSYIDVQSFCFCNWSLHEGYAYFMICCCFGVPCGVMMVCNVLIFMTVRKSRLRAKGSQPEALHGENTATATTSFSVNTPSALSRDNSTHSDVSNPGDILVKRPTNEREVPRNSANLHADWKETIQVLPENGTAESDTDGPPVVPPVDPATQQSPSTASATTNPKRERPKRKRVGSSEEEIRMAMCLIIVVICFVVCWLPYCISMLLSIYCPGVPRAFHMFTLMIGYANSGCNPIIYGVMNKRYAAGFRNLFCWCRRGHHASMSFSGSSTDGEISGPAYPEASQSSQKQLYSRIG